MKNLMTYVNPSKSFGEEEKIEVKIQIDNSLDLGWKREDILLVTNFPYEYNGIKSFIIKSDVYYDFAPTSTKTSAIENLFERGLIDKDELYWSHDFDVYQNEVITESELELEMADMGLTDKGRMPRWDGGSIFFKENSKDIFSRVKEIMYKYREYSITEEFALMALTTNNLLWITETDSDARAKFVPFNIPGTENFPERVKKLNISYNLWVGALSECYEMATKPIKVVHLHFSSDRLLDSAMYGKNSLKKVLMSERLIKIFHKHGVKGTHLKKMKNLMIYISPEKKFLGNTEDLVKKQIDNSLELSWKKKDIMLLTNFPYQYQGVRATVLDDSVFDDINDKASKSNAIFHLLTQGVVKEAELWWYHNLNVFQLQPMDSSQIDLEDTTAGFMADGSGKFDTGSFFFRKDSDKIFEWMRNRTCRLNTDEATAFMSLTEANYRDINSMYKKLPKKLAKIFRKQ